MDAHARTRSGQFQWADADRIRNQCAGKLFSAIAATHAVTPPQIMSSLGRRPPEFDAAVVMSFALLYAWATSTISRRIWRRQGREIGSVGGVVMIAYASLAAAGAGVLLGEQWAAMMEDLRLRNGHLSYRLDRIPWTHHRLELFIGALAIFWLVSAIQYRTLSRRTQQPATAA